MATKLGFRLDLSADEVLRYYQGQGRYIVVTADNGQRIRFPAAHIRPFIEPSGVHGVFQIQFDDGHKLESLTRS